MSKLKNRGIDLQVSCPGRFSYDVAVVHALIQFHPESGVLLLRGVSENNPVKYYVDKTIALYAGDKHVLHQEENRFSLGKLDFKLEYERFDDDEYAAYDKVRNEMLERAGGHVPHSRLIDVPRKPHVKIDNLILHDNISSGAFGLVCAAVDARTGMPLAMKEVWIKSHNMVQDTSLNVEYLQSSM